MKTFSGLCIVAVALVAASTAAFAATNSLADTAAGKTFGDVITIDPAKARGVSDAMRDSASFGKTVLVAGTIADVCQAKGCWLVVTDGVNQMRVTFKDYAFFVPTDAQGSVLLQGVISREEISEEIARHYAGEGKSDGRPEEIVGSQNVITMEATGVSIGD